MKIQPSEFWQLSLWEFLEIYRHCRARRQVGAITQSDVDRLVERQAAIDAAGGLVDGFR